MATEHEHEHSQTQPVPSRKSCCGAATRGPPVTASAANAKDPVCGMTVQPGIAKGGSAEHDGQTYYFCNPRCHEKFVADPRKYTAPAAPPAHAAHPASHGVAAPETLHKAPAVAVGATYVCPMDPEVRQSTPGACPKCGMALEPETPVAASRTEFVCPMHPEIVRDAPGACPTAGWLLACSVSPIRSRQRRQTRFGASRS